MLWSKYKGYQVAMFISILSGLSITAYAEIEEVVVTAERRESTVTDTPISMTAFDENLIQKFRMERSLDVADQAPNLQIEEVYGVSAPRITLRGVTNADYSVTSNSPVTVYSDGVVLNNTTIQGFAMFDLERVEVLRGPQGTLYGRNSTTGSINFISARPTDELTGYLRATAGRYGQKRFDGAVGGAVSDSLRARLAFTSGESDVWVTNALNGDKEPTQDDKAMRLGLEYDLAENVDVFFKAQWSEYSGEALLFHSGASVHPFFGTPNPGPSDDYRSIVMDLDDRPEDIDSLDIVLQVDWRFSDWTLTSLTGFNDHERLWINDDDASEFPVLHEYSQHESDQFSQEFRLTSDFEGPAEWILGVYYMEENLDALGAFDFTALFFDPDPSNGYGSVNARAQTLDSFAAFAQLDYAFAEKWSAGLGLRWTEDEKTYDFEYLPCIGFPRQDDRSFTDRSLISLDCGGTQERADKADWSAISGKVSIEYRPDDRSLFYASYSKGFKGGAFAVDSTLSDGTGRVDPEDLRSYEAGFKRQAQNGKAVVSGALFFYDYEDLQQKSLVDLGSEDGLPNFVNLLNNVDEAEVYGAEVELQWSPNERTYTMLGFGWVDTEYTDFVQADGTDFSGNEFQNAPEFTFNGLVQYRFDGLGNWSVTPQLDWSFAQGYFINLANDSFVDITSTERYQVETEDDWDVNFRLTFESIDLAFSVTAFIEDIGENQGDITQHYPSFDSLGTSMTNISRPETYGLTFAYEF